MTRKRRGRGEGSVYQRADGLWIASISMGYDEFGKRQRIYGAGATKKEAQDSLQELQKKAAGGMPQDTSRLSVAEYLRHWLGVKKGTVATHTYLPYQRDCEKYLIPRLGVVKLVQLSALHVERLYVDLTAAGVSAAMQKKAGTTLRVALQYAVYPRKLIPHNPAAAVPKPRHTPAEMRVLDPDQVGRFFAAAREDRLFALYATAVDSSAREGELFALLWPDVDWDGSAVTITKALEETKGALLVKEVKTKKSRRRIALSAFTMEALAAHRKAMLAEGNCRPDAPVFCDTRGGYLRKSNVQRRSFNKVLDRAGLPRIRPYDLRHTGATLLLLAGEDAKVVSERLGHSTTRQTQDTYQHVLPGMQERAAAKLDIIFRAAGGGQRQAT